MTTKQWSEVMEQALRNRSRAADPASRTRWRDLVRYVLAKLRAERKLQEPPAGELLKHSIGRAVVTAKAMEVLSR